MTEKSRAIVPKTAKHSFTDEQKEFLFRLRTTNTRLGTIAAKFNEEFYDPEGREGKHRVLISDRSVSKFFRTKAGREEYSSYLQQQIHRIQELPFASPSGRVIKLAEIVDDSKTRTREKIEALKQICLEQKLIEDRLSESRPEPLVLLKMEALDDEDPMLETEMFTKTKQLFIQLMEEYGDDVGREIRKLIKEFRDHGGSFDWEESPRLIEAEIVNDGNSTKA